MQRLRETLLQRADDEAPHEARVAEAHLGLGGMDVDVDLAADRTRRRGPATACRSARQKIEVGRPQRTGENLVAHGAAVNENELRDRVRPTESREADSTLEPHPLARRLELEANSRRSRAQGPAAGALPARSRSPRTPASRRTRRCRSRRRSASRRSAEREAPDDVGDRLGFAPVGLQELEPRRRRGEEIARLDPRAERAGAGLDRALRPVLDEEPRAPSARPPSGCGSRAGRPRRSRAALRRGSRRWRSRSDRRPGFSRSRAARRKARGPPRSCRARRR